MAYGRFLKSKKANEFFVTWSSFREDQIFVIKKTRRTHERRKDDRHCRRMDSWFARTQNSMKDKFREIYKVEQTTPNAIGKLGVDYSATEKLRGTRPAGCMKKKHQRWNSTNESHHSSTLRWTDNCEKKMRSLYFSRHISVTWLIGNLIFWIRLSHQDWFLDVLKWSWWQRDW